MSINDYFTKANGPLTIPPAKGKKREREEEHKQDLADAAKLISDIEAKIPRPNEKLSDEAAKVLAKSVAQIQFDPKHGRFRATTHIDSQTNIQKKKSFSPATLNSFLLTVEASKTHREAMDKKKKEAAAVPEDERRAMNVEKHSDSPDLERIFIVETFLPALGSSEIVAAMEWNDSTRSDAGIAHIDDPDAHLRFQTKVTRKNSVGNSMQFKECENYRGMPMLLWNIAAEKGVVVDGDLMHEETTKKKNDEDTRAIFTFETVKKKPYFISIVDKQTLRHVFEKLLLDGGKVTNSSFPTANTFPSYELKSEVYCRWEMESRTHIVEMVGNKYLLSKEHILSPHQNGLFDTLSPPFEDIEDGVQILRRLTEQNKFANRVKGGREGFLFPLRTIVGRKNGKAIKGEYRVNESGKPPFEILNVFASEKGMLSHWRFVVSGLLDGSSTHKYPGGVELPFASIFAIKDETTGKYVGGVQSAFVYDPEEHVPKLQKGDKNRSWVFTKDHIVAKVPLSSFLTEEYISKMPTASQKVVREMMRPDAGPRRVE